MTYSKKFITLFTANLLIVASYGAFFLLPLFIEAKGGSEMAIGLHMGIFALSSAICRPWVAGWIDRFGRRRCYVWGCLIMTLLPLTYLPFYFHPQLPLIPFALIRALHGIGLALCFTTVFTWIADLLPAERLNEGLGIFGISGLVGLAVGPFVAQLLIDTAGFVAFFCGAGILAAISLLLIAPLQATSDHLASTGLAQGFFQLMWQPRYRYCALTTFVFGMGLAAPGSFIASYLEHHQLPSIALYYLAYSGAAIAIRYTAGHLADRHGELRIIPPAFIIMAGGLLAILLIVGTKTLVLAGLLIGSGHGLLFPALNSLTLRHAAAPVRGKLTGIFTGSLDSGIFIGSIVCGVIGEHAGWTALFSSSAMMVLSALLLLPALKRNGSASQSG